MNPFLEKLNSYGTFEMPLLSFMSLFLNYRQIKRGQFLLKPGQISDNIYFIESGIIAAYYKNGDNPVYTDFWGPGDLIFNAGGFIAKERSSEYLWIYKPGLVHVLSRDHYETICKEFPEFTNCINRLLIESHKTVESKLRILRSKPGDRYQAFKKEYPHIYGGIPFGFLTSYLAAARPTIKRGRMATPLNLA
jgi:CRP-like cAMP-binding protein